MLSSARLTVTAAMVFGLLLMQAAWILTMPPFAGMDEFDHAYRASAAGHGEWSTDLGIPHDGRGLLVTVNDGIASAARPQCEVLQYPGPDNCRPVRSEGAGMVAIASAAAIYQPTYYVTVGWVTWFLDGYPALYAMRMLSALLCAGLFGIAVWVITGWARSAWPLLAASLVLTPTTLYSLVIVAPNGLEVMLSLALWACLIGVTRPLDRNHRHRLLVAAVPLAAIFAWVRPFSPIWLLLFLCVWGVLLGRSGVRSLLRQHTTLVAAAAAVIATSASTSAVWVLLHPSTGESPVPEFEGSRLGKTLGEIPLWFFQVISAVPFRDLPASLDVYAAGLIVFILLLTPVATSTTPRLRRAAVCVGIGAIGVGALYTYSRLPTAGTLWQGRYAWCAALAVVLLAGVALEERRLQAPKILGLIVAVPSLMIMHLRALDFVLDYERENSPLDGTSAWITVSGACVITLGMAGLLLWLAGAWHSQTRSYRETGRMRTRG